MYTDEELDIIFSEREPDRFKGKCMVCSNLTGQKCKVCDGWLCEDHFCRSDHYIWRSHIRYCKNKGDLE